MTRTPGTAGPAGTPCPRDAFDRRWNAAYDREYPVLVQAARLVGLCTEGPVALFRLAAAAARDEADFASGLRPALDDRRDRLRALLERDLDLDETAK